jgi:NAD(P)-dependent dehydrogenase (short-subunit alcohol dehydrogenase family)
MRGLADKVVVVAGGGSGIGAATARRLGAEGAAVVVGDLNGDNASTVANEVRDAGGRAIAVQFDIADDASVAALVAAAIGEYGQLDAMHANAADLSPDTIGRDTNALDVPLDVFAHTLDVNLKGHLLCTRHALPHLLERGGGALVYTSSAAGHIGEPERPSYAASKAGINSLVRHVASHWGRQGVVGRSPRLGRPDDIAGMVAFLVSDDGEWVNGQVLSVDGGASMRP